MAWFSTAASNRRQKAKQLQKEAKLAEKERKRQESIGRKDVGYFKPRLINACSQQGMMYILRPIMQPDAFDALFLGKRPIQRVKFSHIFFDQSRIWFRVDSSDLPQRVSILDFKEEGFLATVSDALAREVKCYRSPGSGTWLVIERDGSTAGVPTYVKMQDALEAIPKEADELTVMLGMGEHSIWHYGSLTEWQHLLVAGQTNSGKSVWMNNAVITLALRNTPDQLRFMMVDLKNGVELGLYKHLPHLWRMAKKPEEVEKSLNEFIAEMNMRGELFESAGVRNLQEWNKKFPEQKLPFIILLIDELSRLLLNADSKIRKISKFLLNDVLATARAYGMHVIMCTQDPASEVVPRYLKTNCPARLCFSMPSVSASITVLNHKGAHRLGIKGRAIFQYSEDDLRIQGPFIGTSGIKKAMRYIIEMEAQRQKAQQEPALQLVDVLRYSLEHLDGSLKRTSLLEHFQSMGISKRRLETWFDEAQGKSFELVPGEWFCIENKIGGTVGRRLVPALSPHSELYDVSQAAD